VQRSFQDGAAGTGHDLATGALDFVGYGVTEFDDNNTQRRQVSDDISDLTPGVMRFPAGC
jgi:hypothetical protein